MKLAHEIARKECAAYKRQFPGHPGAWKFAIHYGLKQAWQQAKGRRANFRQAARLAQMSADEKALADREAALFGAAMIDNTARMLAAVAGIEAKRPEMRP